jgi:hypothetical protein
VTAPPPGPRVTLLDAVEPALPAGHYLIRVQQEASGQQVDATYRHEQPVIVTGRSFGLEPGDVRSVYPPAGATADYGGSLPHVRLRRAGLPWEIQAGGDPALEGSPWLALLLLTPEELAADDPAITPTATGSHPVALRDYLEPPADIAGPRFSPAQLDAFRQQNPPDFTVSVIDIQAAAFDAIAPHRGEVRLLAHAETLDEGDGAGDAGAVVIGSRLARGSESGVYIAHLVSVQGFMDRLPPAPGHAGHAVRMLSLASWTYASAGGSHDFASLMRGLDVGLLRLPDALPAPDGEAERQVAAALAGGYVAADYQTRLGERTIAWYRGPCLPVAMKPNPQPPYWSAEAAAIYDPATGLFDVSFAVAWQLGRLLMLADQHAAAALRRWLDGYRRDVHQLAGQASAGRAGPRVPPAADGALQKAVTALAALGDAGHQPFGPPTDPSGLRGQLARLPGLLDPADLPGILAVGGDASAALLERIRAAAGPARPGARS